MSDSTKVEPVESAKIQAPKQYRFSVLLTGFGRLFRSFLALAIVILLNAIVQALLVGVFDPQPTLTPLFIVLLLISLAVFLWSFHCFNIVALDGATGKPSLAAVFRRTPGQMAWFVLWAFVVYVLVLLGMLISPYVAILAIILFPFLTLAATDGKSNPFKTNFQVMGGRIWRYLISAIIFLPLLGLSVLFTSVNGFFIGGGIGSFITWIFWGIIGAWYLNALGLIYRSTLVGALAVEPAETASETS